MIHAKSVFEETNVTTEKLILATPVDFEIVDPEKKNLPATLESVKIFRHPLMEGKVTKDLAILVDELEIDRKLGLIYQAQETTEEILRKDIDELTSSKDFFEVSRKLVEKLFSLGKLKITCFFSNVKEAIHQTLIVAGPGIAMVLGGLLLFIPVIILWSHLGKIPESKVTAGIFCLFFLNVAFSMGLGVLVIAGYVNMFYEKTYRYDFLKVQINYVPLNEAQVKIPRGAKLKVLEAQETKIFEGFVLASPKFIVEHKEVQFSRPDPAILGVTKDKRLFMIVYWDVERDVERVVKDIETFKKFKLPRT
jgi:hypothetical protein